MWNIMLSQRSSPNDKWKIDDMLSSREDLSPFLVHLTRNYHGKTARENLASVIQEKTIRFEEAVSAARYSFEWKKMSNAVMRKFFTAVCFTETPLTEIHSCIGIEKFEIIFQPYGLAFLKNKCVEKGVSPVLYFNDVRGDKDKVVRALCSLAQLDPSSAAQILPYVS